MGLQIIIQIMQIGLDSQMLNRVGCSNSTLLQSIHPVYDEPSNQSPYR